MLDSGMASTSLLQRNLKLGYARAARIIDQLEEKGIVGPHQGAKPREVLITRQDWIQMQTTGVAASAPKNESKQLSFDDAVAENFDEDFDEDDTENSDNSSEDTSEDEFDDNFVEIETEHEDVRFTDDDEPTVHLDKDDDEELDYIDEDFLNNI